MLTDAAIAAMRSYLIRSIDHAQYTVDGEDYHKTHHAVIQSAEVMPDGRAAFTLMLNPGVSGEVTHIALRDRNNTPWAEHDERITCRPDEGILYRFRVALDKE